MRITSTSAVSGREANDHDRAASLAARLGVLSTVRSVVGVVTGIAATAWFVLGTFRFFTHEDGSTRFAEAVVSAYLAAPAAFIAWPLLALAWLVLDVRIARLGRPVTPAPRS